MRLLVSAFSLCPGMGSEPGVGWHTVAALAREHEVHALVEVTCEPKIRPVFRAEEHPRIHLHYVGIPLLTALVQGPLRNGPCLALYYYVWQFFAWFAASRLCRQHQFDACQHVTFVKYNVPSFLHLLGLPFVWGPVGGAERAPAVFYREFGFKTRVMEAARVWLQKAAYLDPFVRWCTSRSTLALGVTNETAAELRGLGARRVEVLSAVALSQEELSQIAQRPAAYRSGMLTLVYAGRLIAWKGVHLALRALAQAPQTMRLRVIGDGELRPFLELETARLGLIGRVEFAGDLPRAQVLAAYASADGFLYPSLHDSGGNALLEAMAAGLPAICLAYGGPDAIVTPDCGWKIHAASPEAAVSGLAEALRDFAFNPAKRQAFGAAARARCLAEFSWDRRAETWLAKYRELAP